MTPSAFDARLVLGLVPDSRVPAFHRHLLSALEVANPAQRTALADAFPGLVIAWMMCNHGSPVERSMLVQIANS